MRTFLYGELALYPSLKMIGRPIGQVLKESTRFSAGFGISFPVNNLISIMVYFNALNLNSRTGDHERKGFLNLNIGFF